MNTDCTTRRPERVYSYSGSHIKGFYFTTYRIYLRARCYVHITWTRGRPVTSGASIHPRITELASLKLLQSREPDDFLVELTDSYGMLCCCCCLLLRCSSGATYCCCDDHFHIPISHLSPYILCPTPIRRTRSPYVPRYLIRHTWYQVIHNPAVVCTAVGLVLVTLYNVFTASYVSLVRTYHVVDHQRVVLLINTSSTRPAEDSYDKYLQPTAEYSYTNTCFSCTHKNQHKDRTYFEGWYICTIRTVRITYPRRDDDGTARDGGGAISEAGPFILQK